MMSFNHFLINERRKNKYDYSSLLIELPEDITDNVISWGFDNIPNDSLFLDPNDPEFGREEDIHITLIYGLHTENARHISELFVEEKEFECKLGNINLFTKNKNFDVLVVDVECEKLHELNLKVKRELEVTESYPIYIPHVTICYLKKGHCKSFLKDNVFDGEKFMINKILFSSKTGVKTPIKLGKLGKVYEQYRKLERSSKNP